MPATANNPSANRTPTNVLCREKIAGLPREWFLAAVLLILVVAAYLPSLGNGFIWDDDAYVTANSTLRNLHGLWRIWFDPTATPQYYPLVHTGFWLEYHLWGLRPLGFHLVNVLLHALAAILFWRVLLRLQMPGAWLAAAIFALHPVAVESVAWITERKNVLSAVFYFASALAYLRFSGLPETEANGRRPTGFYFGALLLFVAAMLSKTVTCSLPAALLLVVWWKRGRLRWSDALPLLPFFLIGIGLGLQTAWLEKHHAGAQGAEWSLTFLQRCLIAGRALWFYAGKLAWPLPLTFVYPRWEVSTGVWWQWLFPVAAIGVVMMLWLARRRIGRGPLAAVLFFAGTLLPALGFVNAFPFRYSFVADHFQYLGSVGLMALAAAGLCRFPKIVPAALLLALGLLTWRQTGIYKNLETLWRDTLVKNPNSWLANNNLGQVLEQAGDLDGAALHFRAAQRAEPAYFEAYYNLGNILIREGQPDEAIGNYRAALKLNPGYVEAINSLGVALAMKENYAEAALWFHKAIWLQPNLAKAHANLGNAFREQHQLDAAIAEFNTALRLDPNSTDARNNLGLALEEKGELAEAARQFLESARITPSDPSVHLNLGRIQAQLGQWDDAAAQFRETLRLQPDNAEAKKLLDALEKLKGK